MATIKLSIEDMPKVLAGIRREIANMLRAEAEGEPEFVASKLREIAARFESGMESD